VLLAVVVVAGMVEQEEEEEVSPEEEDKRSANRVDKLFLLLGEEKPCTIKRAGVAPSNANASTTTNLMAERNVNNGGLWPCKLPVK
jgi:hypothetical protein